MYLFLKKESIHKKDYSTSEDGPPRNITIG